MKKFITLALMALLFSTQACSQAVYWQEGKHYTVIAQKASDKPEVMEFFSYWCPACYNFEPIVEQIKKKLPDNVAFKKVHVNFMGFASKEVQDEVTKTMVAGRTLGLEAEVTAGIFNQIHVLRKPVTGYNDLKDIFVANGVDGEKFDKAVKGFAVNSQFKANNKLIDQYRSHLSGVPNFIVNGKYQAKFTRDMTGDDIVDLIVWLSTQN
ncbi:MAG: thioredoxin domain-containing protein [Alteromonadaceae bacterium]|nr:thioredoxin domain-containing protein [Alteromonadaceae bacterium]